MLKQVKLIIFSCMYILGIISFFSNWIIYGFIFIALSLLLIRTCKNFNNSFFINIYSFIEKLNFKTLIVYFSIFFVGILNAFINLKFDDDLTYFTDKNVELTAQVTTIPSNNKSDKTGFYAKIIQINTDETTQKINAKTYITINDETDKIKNIKIGDIINAKGKLKRPNYAQNPSQFDYSKYLQYRKTFSLFYVNKDWKVINSANNLSIKFIRKLNDIRSNIIQIHAQNIKSPMLEILGGIIFGDDAVNPDEITKTNFINSGIFHILAASGMNVTLIFGIWFFFAKRLKMNYQFSIISGIALILFYTCMTGFGPPIIRAFLMLTLILIGKLIDKKTSTMSLLFIVAFLMLLVNPLMIFDIGFQLSFIVTFALILTSSLIIFNFRYKFLNYILGASCIPLIAQLFAAPLQMYYFNTFSLYSVIANIAIIPVLSLVSFIGFISSIIAIIPSISQQVCYISDLILNPLLVYIVKVAEFFSGLPYALIYIKKPTLFQMILYFSGTIFFVCILKFKLSFKKYILCFLIILSLLILSGLSINKNNLEIIFFSVGNADSALIKSPSNEYFFIDTGKYNNISESSSAKNIMIKYLRDKGIKHINSIILSHYDIDHAGGSIDIMKSLDVENLYSPNNNYITKMERNIKDYISQNKIKYRIIDKEEEIFKDNDFSIKVIHPIGEKIINENQNSLIVLIEYKSNKILFMGDGDVNTYSVLPDTFKKNITVMKSGHHGAINTINEEMIKNTDLFIISTGFNVYNHPHPKILELLNKNKAQYLRTDYHNAIKTVFNGDEYYIYLFSPKKHKFEKFRI